jgi:hypothetical protein
MSDKPIDPFRYSVDTVPPLVRKDLARMAVPELAPAELEPPAGLKQRLGSLGSEGSARNAPATRAKPERAPSPRPLAKVLFVLLALAIFAAVLALARR